MFRLRKECYCVKLNTEHAKGLMANSHWCHATPYVCLNCGSVSHKYGRDFKPNGDNSATYEGFKQIKWY